MSVKNICVEIFNMILQLYILLYVLCCLADGPK